MKRILAQCVKELAQFRRDRLTLALAFLLPLMTLLIFGFAIRLESKNIPLVVQDFDHSNLSQTYIERLFATNQFQPVRWSGDDPMHDAIDKGIAKAAVIIPPDFSRRIKADKQSSVQVLVDGTDANNARVIKNSIKATTNFFLTNDVSSSTQKIQVHTRLWFNPGRKESLYIVPGVYAVVLWIFPSLLAAIAMVREKEKGTILQVYASSLTAAELLLGKALAYLVVGLCEASIIMVLGSLIFRVGFAGDPTPLLIGTPIYLSAAVMFGLLLGVRSANQNAAVQGVSLVGFLTAFLLSGFIYPLSNIPFPLSILPNVVPARYFIIVTRDAFVRGVGWASVWFDILMMLVIGLFFFNVARRALSRMQLPD
ncbi:ABC transporter permease [Stenomitos frigidus]|uniref:ABC transporter permease n=1 Tax=Stenomitos frigidus ULC18 TaxID=2107698 RepID=A0A2T1DW23_9CYAN|nr:ABC transporter permease [Stenomitos frigidus]PSB24641.1 ABC transporter permease [Stenomitos frigidus ULC18]